MPKPKKKEEILGQYFRWLIGQRNGIYFADGRGSHPSLGRRTLETRDRIEALKILEELDLTMAVQLGLAEAHLLKTDAHQILPWTAGRKLYEDYVKRPLISGGPRASTAKRYRAVLDKFIPFAEGKGRRTWNELNRQLMHDYAGWLVDNEYEYATQYLELTTLKQILKYLIEYKYLPSSLAFRYPLRKPNGTTTYSFTPAEVKAIITYCDRTEFRWLRHVIIGLAATGLRISELGSLRWTDINLTRGMISLTDESTMKAKKGKEKRTTKSGRNRSLPIQDELLEVLSSMPHHPDGLVFHGPLGGRIKADTVRTFLVDNVLTPLAPQFPSESGEGSFIDGRLHSFRHFFCSNCANRQVPERVLMNWLGHRHSRMVHRYYHLHDEESIRQMKQVKLY